MNRIATDRPKIIITASPRGVETVSIRVPPGGRDVGLLFLRQVLPAIRTVNLRARVEPRNRAARPRATEPISGRGHVERRTSRLQLDRRAPSCPT
jgi:hypothetical protein